MGTKFIKTSSTIMGGKESKMKRAFEAIDVSGDGKVTKGEMSAYLETDKAKKLLKKFNENDYKEFQQEVHNLDANDKDKDGKFTFEEFKAAVKVKDNDKFKKFILEAGDSSSDSDSKPKEKQISAIILGKSIN